MIPPRVTTDRGKRQLIREGGSASRVSDHARPRDPGGGTVPTVSPRRTIIDDVSQAVGQSGGGGGGPQLVSPGGLTLAEDTPVESLYGGGVSSLPGAAGDLPPVMFPVAPVLLAGGPQASPWQVAVVRVDETPTGDSSERKYRGVTQSRHRPIDIYELPDCLPHTVVEGGPAGPEVIEPLALLVRDHADPAGQHAVMRNTIVKGGPAGPEVIEPLELLVLDHVAPAGQHAVIWDTTRLLERPLVRPESSLSDGLVERISDGEPAARQVPDTALDSRPMEGTTYLEQPALGVSLDSGLRAGMSSIEPTRQSVLNMLSVIRPDETDRPEHPALASQMHYEQSCFKSSAWPMPDPDLNDHTYVNEDINKDFPESTALMMNSQMDHKQSCFNPSARPMLDSDMVIPTDVNVDIDADPPQNSAPMMNSDLIVLELDDAIRHEVLRNRTMENMSPHEFNDQLLSSEYVNLKTTEMFLDQARSVGQWQ